MILRKKKKRKEKKTEFIIYFKELLRFNKTFKNNLIIGDFNIDINSDETIDQELLQMLLKNGYYPGFNDITRPNINYISRGNCINNCYIKLHKIRYKSYTIHLATSSPLLISLKKFKQEK